MTKQLDYLRSFIPPPSSLTEKLASSNRGRNDIQPPVEPEVGSLLAFLITITKSYKILELGTSTGYSTLWMASALPDGGTIDTVESKKRLYDEAVKTFKASGYDGINPLFGPAEEIVPALEGPYDLIFQDCGKYLYPELFEHSISILKPGGILIADDTLFKAIDSIRDSLSGYTDQYNTMAFQDKRLFTTMIPIGHGLTLSYKKELK